MNRTARAHHHRAEPYLKYLKPGALAQLRDSRISARSHRLHQISLRRQSPPSPPPPHGVDSQIFLRDGFPCFAGRSFGPRFPQRKKLAALKGFSYLALRANVPEPDSSDLIVDQIGGDVIAAH